MRELVYVRLWDERGVRENHPEYGSPVQGVLQGSCLKKSDAAYPRRRQVQIGS